MKEWLRAEEIAAERLPGLPSSKRGVNAVADRLGWRYTEQCRLAPGGRGGGREYRYSLFSPEAQAAYLASHINDQDTQQENRPSVKRKDNAALWAWFERQDERLRSEGGRRIAALERLDDLTKAERPASAIALVAAQENVSAQTIRNWVAIRRRAPRENWLPALVPDKRGGGGRPVEVCEKVWDAFRTDYLRPSRPSFNSCYRRVADVAKAKGWEMPNARTLRRRVEAIPEAVLTMAREGRDATKRLFPAQERDRSQFHALEAVNADGHKWDVFVQWEDGTIGRPMMIAFQDLYSNMFLGWRIGRSENKDLVRLCFGDVIENYGIPDYCWLDNGRAFASKWLTGGTPNRFRFKVKPEEPLGLLTQLGVKVHWTTPYAGQSKPIERGFGDFARDIAKLPEFEGAYTGNKPDAKPENYGTAAVPIETFRAIIDREIAKHNARPGRQTKVCGGKLSFLQAFNASYAQAPIRKAAAEQRRLCMLAAEGVRVRAEDGSIHLMGNRYWHQKLLEHRGRPVTVRFDPENLHSDLAVYGQDGALLCIAELAVAAGFADTDAARRHAANRNAFIRATAEAAKAEKAMSLAELVQLQAQLEPDAPKPAAARVVRPIFGNLALKSRAQVEEDEDDFDAKFARGVRLVTQLRGGAETGD